MFIWFTSVRQCDVRSPPVGPLDVPATASNRRQILAPVKCLLEIYTVPCPHPQSSYAKQKALLGSTCLLPRSKNGHKACANHEMESMERFPPSYWLEEKGVGCGRKKKNSSKFLRLQYFSTFSMIFSTPGVLSPSHKTTPALIGAAESSGNTKKYLWASSFFVFCLLVCCNSSKHNYQWVPPSATTKRQPCKGSTTMSLHKMAPAHLQGPCVNCLTIVALWMSPGCNGIPLPALLPSLWQT